jgi:thiol-disulfide isomerase/thioredoxin
MMDTILLLVRLVLAAIFAVAGLAKLADRAGSRQALIDFGVPARLAGVPGVLLPLAELSVAVALVPAASAWWGSVGALGLLLLFLAGIGFNLARGRRPDCRCFGQLHSEPVGRSTLSRNAVLAAMAGFVVLQGPERAGTSTLAWPADLSTGQFMLLGGGVLILGALVVEGWLLFQLLRQNGRLMLRLDELEARLAGEAASAVPAPASTAPSGPGTVHHASRTAGLPVGAPAPGFQLANVDGQLVALDSLVAARLPLLLLFMDPNCGPCNGLMPEVGRWQREHADKATIAVVSRGRPEANRAKTAEHGITNILLQNNYEVADSYQAHGTPGAVVVRPDSTVGSPVALGPDAIRALAASTLGLVGPETLAAAPAEPVPAAPSGNGAAAVPSAPPSPRRGQPAPRVKLRDLDGKPVELGGRRGDKTLLLFWNNGCGFCQQMLPDLKAWEASPPPEAPKLVLVSTGSADENRALGLRSPVLLDDGFSAGRAFGANGTPMAVLIDGRGKIASEVAAGAQAVLALANGQPPPVPQAAGNGAPRPALPTTPMIGEPAPALELQDLDGNTVRLAERPGKKTLLLFWNPGCGFCQQMLPELKALEENPPKDAPELLVVTAGSLEANREQGLRSAVVLDQNFSAGSAFGASGTPSGLLVDEQGNVASELAVGAPGVLALATGQTLPMAANDLENGPVARPVPRKARRKKAR